MFRLCVCLFVCLFDGLLVCLFVCLLVVCFFCYSSNYSLAQFLVELAVGCLAVGCLQYSIA